MRILFDQGVPVPLRRAFPPSEVKTAYEMGWSNLENGALLKEAEIRFDIFVTTDKNLAYQQNVIGRRLAILVLPTPRWPDLQPVAAEIAGAVLSLKEGDFIHWQMPERPAEDSPP
jgi:hypothetical protein